MAADESTEFKLKQRGEIEFLTLEGNSPQQILERMVNVYGDEAPPNATVQ